MSDGVAIRTNWKDGIREAIDAHEGHAISLADDESYSRIFGMMDAASPASVYATSTPATVEDVLAEQGLSQWPESLVGPPLQPYRVLGAMEVLEDGILYTTFMLDHGTQDHAIVNASILMDKHQYHSDAFMNQTLSEIFDVFEVTVDGTMVIVRTDRQFIEDMARVLFAVR